jgi:SAM-dependent methyltransferase
MPDYYMERVQRMLDLAAKYPLLHDGFRMLELGTGWMHWEALTTRLFFRIEADLYDVWDNRQFAALKSYLSQFVNRMTELKGVTAGQSADVVALCEEILATANFEDLYRLLGFRYIVDSRGMLESVADGLYDLVVSAGVFEHLPRGSVKEYIRQTHRVLKPGGFAVHSINTADHLHLYDTATCPKNYLRYSDKVWKLFFENELQYINRLQRCEWMTIFEEAGFVCIEECGSRCDLGEIVVNERFQAVDQVSLETTSWYAVYQKPASV